MIYKFSHNDVFYNQIKTYPKNEFIIFDGNVYYQDEPIETGEFGEPIKHVPHGHVNLFELNIDRPTGQLIYPFITKDGALESFRTISISEFNNNFVYGDVITGSYPLSASIYRNYYQQGQSRRYVDGLYNILNKYSSLSPHHYYSSSLGDKGDQELTLISIPSILYGSSIRKGSVDLKFYISGSLYGRCVDLYKNGNLIEVTGSDIGKVAGVVLYNEGFIVLTGSWVVDPVSRNYLNDITNLVPFAWKYFGAGMNDGVLSGVNPSASFSVNFEGVEYVPVVTMFAHAPKGELNHSNNPTFVDFTYDLYNTPNSGSGYHENRNALIKNIVKTPYLDPTGSFEKITYISSIAIMDEEKNVLGWAKLANPLRKTELDDYTFKIKVDI